MNFNRLKLKDIMLALRIQTDIKHWVSRNRPYQIIGFALSGNELHDLGYQRFNIEENCIFFLNKRDDFTAHAYEMGACYCIHFTAYEEIDDDSFCIWVSYPAPILQLFRNIEKQLKLDPGGGHLVAAQFYRLCALFEEIHQKKYAHSDKRMLNAKKYLDLHFFEPHCLTRVYETCDLSRRRFDELFKQFYDITPSRYITAQRMEHAKKLLHIPNLSIQEIADMCGFSDIHYFSKVFKTQTNVTPSAFRKNIWARVSSTLSSTSSFL